MKRLILLIAASSVLAPSAWSDVIYSGYQNIAVPQHFDGVYLNIATGATTFAQPGDYNTAPWINPFFGGVDIGNGALLRPVITGADQIVNLGTGTLVSSGSTFAAGESGSSTHVGPAGNQFTLGTPGNIGFQFEATTGGATRFGSLNITINNASPGVIRDWAYDNAGGSIVIGRVQQSAPAAGAQTFTLSPGTGETFTLGSAIIDTGGNINSLLKTGAGTTTLAATNTFTGSTTVSGGTLEVATALGGTTSIAVNNGGTLLLSGTGGNNTKLSTTAPVTLAGGKIDLGGLTSSLDQTVGALTLSASSTFDLGTSAAGHEWHFAPSNGDWSGRQLSIFNYTPNTDRLFFGASSSALNSPQLDHITFFSDAGMSSLGSAQFAGAPGEVSPVPEPATIVGAVGLLGLVAWRERRRVHRWVMSCASR